MLTKENLLSVVSFVSGIPESEIMSQNRARGYVLCRHAYYFIAREKMGLKLVDIGSLFGADHTTVIHGITKVRDMLSIGDEITKQFIDQVNLCIAAKYLIPTRLIVSIPSEIDSEEAISYLRELGCEIEKINYNI
jgi:hypothetical protein